MKLQQSIKPELNLIYKYIFPATTLQVKNKLYSRLYYIHRHPIYFELRMQTREEVTDEIYNK
jgi:hypothetical protein